MNNHEEVPAASAQTAVKDPTANAEPPPVLSLFDEHHRRAGRDPEAERARMKFRLVEEDRQLYLHARLRCEDGPRGGAPPRQLLPPSSPMTPAKDEELERLKKIFAGITNRDELREFITDLLFDDIYAIATGILEGEKSRAKVAARTCEGEEGSGEGESQEDKQTNPYEDAEERSRRGRTADAGPARAERGR